MIAGLESSHLLQPKRLTLKFERKTTKEILDAMAKETGIKIEQLRAQGRRAFRF